MSIVFDEGTLRFEFGDAWTVVNYDAERYYREKVQQLQETQAVDFLGIHRRRGTYFIEVKDYRSYQDTSGKLFQNELAQTVGRKVRDTIAGVIGASRSESDPSKWDAFKDGLCAPDRADRLVRVVLWFEDDSPHAESEWKVKALVIQDKIKQSLRWYTTKILVTKDPASLPDLRVCNLPRPRAR